MLSFAFSGIRYDVFGELKLGGPGGQRIPETESVLRKLNMKAAINTNKMELVCKVEAGNSPVCGTFLTTSERESVYCYSEQPPLEAA